MKGTYNLYKYKASKQASKQANKDGNKQTGRTFVRSTRIGIVRQ
jgi:hypothetical protein